MKLLMPLIVAAALAWAAPARADYVCSVHYRPTQAASTGGDYGQLYVSYYTGPDCTGTFTYGVYYCSLNATDSSCAYPGNPSCSLPSLYNSNAMMQLWASHQQAQLYNQRVTPFACTATIGTNPVFYSN